MARRKPKRVELQDRLGHLQGELRGLLQEAVGSAGPVPLAGGCDFREAVANHERVLITTALQMTGGKQKEAARLLHLSRSTLCTKIKTLGIDVGEFN